MIDVSLTGGISGAMSGSLISFGSARKGLTYLLILPLLTFSIDSLRTCQGELLMICLYCLATCSFRSEDSLNIQ